MRIGRTDYHNFEQIIIEKFLSRCNNGLLAQLLDILDCYWYDGSQEAKNAIHVKYDCFAAKKGRLIKSGGVDEGYQWDDVVYELFYMDGFAAFKRYVLDIGEILLKNPNNTKHYYDSWYQRRAVKKFGEKRINDYLDKMYAKSEAIKAVVDTIKADESSFEQHQKQREKEYEQKRVTVSDLLQIAKSAVNADYPRAKMMQATSLFHKHTTETEVLELANAVIQEKNETVKALLLHSFFRKPFPLDITPLLEYAQSDNELLAETAVGRLEEIKDKRIHNLAVDLLKTKGAKSFALILFKKNHKKSDDEIIAKAVKKLPSVSHLVQQNINDIYNHNCSKNALPVLLRVYRGSECTFCREYTVRAMNYCGVLSDEILEECLWDSNSDIRDYVKRVMTRRGKK